MIKQMKEQFLQYAKEKIFFKKKAKSKLFGALFGLTALATLGGVKTAYAASADSSVNSVQTNVDQGVDDLSHLQFDFNDVIVDVPVATQSNADSSVLGDKVYANVDAKIYQDEYSLKNQEHGLKMRYPDTEKEITGIIFDVQDVPKIAANEEKVQEYRDLQCAEIGYLVNGNEGFFRIEDVHSKEFLATPSNATPSNATPSNATPSNVTPTNAIPSNATPSNATPSNVTPTNATPSNATPSNATSSNATPSNATPSNATSSNATPTNATPSNATPSNATSSNATSILFKINDQVSIHPTAKYYKNVNKLIKSKNGKKYNYRKKFNKITGIVVSFKSEAKVYHGKDIESLLNVLNTGGKVVGYEVNHSYYLKNNSVYQKNAISMDPAELNQKTKNLYQSDVELTVLADAKIYSNADNMRNERDGKNPYYKAGSVKQASGYVLTDGKESFITNDYDQAVEYVSLGYQFDGYRMSNMSSKSEDGKIVSFEGYFKSGDVVTKVYYDENLASASNATPSNATPSNATPSNATSTKKSANSIVPNYVADDSELKRFYFMQMKECLENQRQIRKGIQEEKARTRTL